MTEKQGPGAQKLLRRWATFVSGSADAVFAVIASLWDRKGTLNFVLLPIACHISPPMCSFGMHVCILRMRLSFPFSQLSSVSFESHSLVCLSAGKYPGIDMNVSLLGSSDSLFQPCMYARYAISVPLHPYVIFVCILACMFWSHTSSRSHILTATTRQ